MLSLVWVKLREKNGCLCVTDTNPQIFSHHVDACLQVETKASVGVELRKWLKATMTCWNQQCSWSETTAVVISYKNNWKQEANKQACMCERVLLKINTDDANTKELPLSRQQRGGGSITDHWQEIAACKGFSKIQTPKKCQPIFHQQPF